MTRTRRHMFSGEKTILLLLFMLVAIVPTYSQRASVQATVQPAEIEIGEQALINLKVIAPKDKTIHFPVFEKDIVPGLEVLTMLPPDTLIENEVATMNFKYVVTSFDSTLYFIPHLSVFDGTDTIFSNSLGLKVTSPVLKDSTVAYLEKLNTGQTDSIDFKQLQLNDIKAIQKPPFVWTDYLWLLWILLGVVVLILLIGVVILLVLRKKKKGYFFTPPVVLPPHARALRELDKIKAEKIWQHGREKEFYTRITDILRRYIHDRYKVNAMEMTSGEILDEIRRKADTDSICENLRQILSVSDMVKFAKYTPFQDENDLSIVNAYLFVNQTREPDPVPDPKTMKQTGAESEATEKENEQRQ